MKPLGKEITDRFKYCEHSPTGLVWNETIYRGYNNSTSVLRSVGDIAGYLREDGYCAVTSIHFGEVMAHRIIWELFYGEIPSGYFIDHKDGNRANNQPNNLRLVLREKNARNIQMMTTNKSGITGVSFDDKGSGNTYWKVKWNGLDRKSHYKVFSINRLGNEEAFKQACEYREKMIEELNAQGAGYTERHGK